MSHMSYTSLTTGIRWVIGSGAIMELDSYSGCITVCRFRQLVPLQPPSKHTTSRSTITNAKHSRKKHAKHFNNCWRTNLGIKWRWGDDDNNLDLDDNDNEKVFASVGMNSMNVISMPSGGNLIMKKTAALPSSEVKKAVVRSLSIGEVFNHGWKDLGE